MKHNLSLLTTTNFAHAQILASRLELYGIPCYIRNMNLIGPEINEEVEIWLSEANIAKAGRLIREFHFNKPENGEKPKSQFTKLIVVPVDFSPSTANAARYAVEIAAIFGARVKLVHTYMIPQIQPVSMEGTDVLSEAVFLLLAELRKNGENSLNELRLMLTSFMDKKGIKVPIETYQINGFVDEITLFLAEQEKAGLILLGLSRDNQQLFGIINDNITRIVEHSKIPVLVVTENADRKPSGKPRNILYASNFDESDFVAIQKLISFIQKDDCNLFCTHIESKEDPWDKVKLEGLRNFFGKKQSNIHLKFETILASDTLEALNQSIKSHEIDLMAITAHKHNYLSKLISKGVTKKLIYHTNIPLLIFHSN